MCLGGFWFVGRGWAFWVLFCVAWAERLGFLWLVSFFGWAIGWYGSLGCRVWCGCLALRVVVELRIFGWGMLVCLLVCWLELVLVLGFGFGLCGWIWYFGFWVGWLCMTVVLGFGVLLVMCDLFGGFWV